jgi:cysteine desulfurase
MNRFHLEDYAVASSQFSHTPGIRAKDGVEAAREIIRRKINGGDNPLVFTSGEEESNTLAVRGVAEAGESRNRIVLSKIEHFSVLHTAQKLSRRGYDVAFAEVDGEGFVDLDRLRSLVDDRTLLVSVMHGNHEVGTLQDLRAIADIAHSRGAYFHTDASYSFLQTDIDVSRDGIDLMTLDSNKVHGPKGAGALFVSDGVKIDKIIEGGYQEHDLRGGLENVPGIAGFGRAVEIFSNGDNDLVRSLRDRLYEGLTERIENVTLNGASDFQRRIPNNLNVSFDYVEGESVILHLDTRGIAVITGSACFSRALHASHVLLAMGFTHERAHGSIRYSPSRCNGPEDMDYTVHHTADVVEKLRELSPLTAAKPEGGGS